MNPIINQDWNVIPSIRPSRARDKSFIYFDSPNIQNGVYDRNSFYFQLEAFTIDSLDNFRPEAIAPHGTFTSAGILPPLEMQMTLREDNSLGFYHADT